MSLAITVNNADYSSNAIGWEAPTTAQPDMALFATNGNGGLKNLSGGRQLSLLSGDRSFTQGVTGASLPFETLGNNAKLETYLALTQKLTIFSLIRFGTGNPNVISEDDFTQIAFQIYQRNVVNNWLVAGNGSEQLTVNSDLVSGKWLICEWSADLTTTKPVVSYTDHTNAVTTSQVGSFSKVYTPNDSFKLGGGGSTGETFDSSVMLFWSDILSNEDRATANMWLRQYASTYGVTA